MSLGVDGAAPRVVVTEAFAADGRGGTASGTEEFVVTGVTGNVTVTVEPTTIVAGQPGQAVPIKITNNSGTELTNLQVDVLRASGPLTWTGDAEDPAWTCTPTGSSVVIEHQVELSCIPTDRTLKPGASITLSAALVSTPANQTGHSWPAKVRVMADGMTPDQIDVDFEVVVQRPAPATAADVLPISAV